MDRFVKSIDIIETNTPGNPAAGYRRIYARPDGSTYARDASGAETKLDNVASGGGTKTPTSSATDLVVSDFTQMLFRRPIRMAAGTKIIIGQDAALIGV